MSSGVLLLAFGGPRSRDEVKPFILEALRGRPVPEDRIEELARRYDEIGGKSPLVDCLLALARALEEESDREGARVPVRAAACHGTPSLEGVLREMAGAGVRRLKVVPLVPQGGQAVLERYEAALASSRRRMGRGAPACELVTGWSEHPLLIDAHAARIREALAGLPEEARSGAAWIFCAHSLPVRAPGVSAYLADVAAVVRAVSSRFGNHSWSLAFQSRSGGREPWLGPGVDEVVSLEMERGAGGVVLVPVSFVLDNVEVLYDLDVTAGNRAREAGVAFARVGTPGLHPSFVKMLAAVSLSPVEFGSAE